MIERNLIHLGDCLDFMREMPDKSVDLVLTDPPYGIGMDGGKIGGDKLGTAKDYKKNDWDNDIPEKAVFDEILRISKNQIIFGGNYFVEYLFNSPCWIVWDKQNSGNFADCELAWTSFGTAVRMFKFMWNGMLQGDMKNKTQRIHPTQKPAQLFQWVLENYSKPGQLIFDPFSGSGTTAIACHTLKRRFICIEKDVDYHAASVERLKEHQAQQSLF